MSQTRIRPAVLLVNNKLGGSERRYARFFITASQMGADIFLFINPALYALEVAAGVRIDRYQTVIRLPTRCNRLLCGGRLLPFEIPHNTHERWFNYRLALARKLDFLLNIGDVWRLAHRLQLTHLHTVVSGILMGLPFFFSRRFKTIIAVPAVDLRTMAPRKIGGLPLFLYLLSWLLRRCDAIDAVSPTVKENLIRKRVSAEKIQVAPCTFTDYEHFIPVLEKQDWVVFAGRFIEVKNPLLFVQAIPQVRKAHPEIRFLILGNGPLQSDIEQQIAQLGIGEATSVRYEVDLAPLLAQSKVFVSVQADENYSSQALLEAMACQNAVVASDVGETYRWVDKETGIRIENTPESLAAAIIMLFDNPEVLKLKGERARERVLQEHTAERFAHHLLDIYAELE